MVVRDRVGSADGLEVLMLKRNVRSEFAGGVYVFPGGSVDPDDGDERAAAMSRGRSDEQASALLGLPAGGLAYWVAALRECFEEAGVLLAYRPTSRTPTDGKDRPGGLLSFAVPEDEARFAAHRSALNAGRSRFLDVCTEEGLELAVDAVQYFAHWITPRGAPRRFDTRFFVAAAPPQQTALHDASETVEHLWTSPAEALALHRAGKIELVLPTIKNLQAIGRFSSTGELLDAVATSVDRVPTVEPRVVVEGNGVRILLPGDPDYDDSAPLEPAPTLGDPAAANAAMRAIGRAANPGPADGPDDPPSPETLRIRS